MKLPIKWEFHKKIIVAGDEEEYPATGTKGTAGTAMTSSMMAIPGRIDIGNFASPTSEIPKDLRDNLGSVNHYPVDSLTGFPST